MQPFVQHLIEGLECTLFLLQVTHHLDLYSIIYIIIDGSTRSREKTSGTTFNRKQIQGNVKSILLRYYSQCQTCISFYLPDFKSSSDFRMDFNLSLQIFEKLLQHRLSRDRYALQSDKPANHCKCSL